jgi:hypothetical protein
VGRGVDAARLLVDVTRVDSWERALPVGVAPGFESAIPETKISRMAAKKLTISKVTIIVLFFWKKFIFTFSLYREILFDSAFHCLRTFWAYKAINEFNLSYHKSSMVELTGKSAK